MDRLVRYLRSPECVLAIANFALMLTLFGFDRIAEIAPYMNALDSALPFPNSINEAVVLSVVLGLLAIFMLPVAWFYLLAVVMEIAIGDDSSVNMILAWLSLPNAVIWGFAVAFLFRLIRTGKIAKAGAATLRWATGRESLENDGMR